MNFWLLLLLKLFQKVKLFFTLFMSACVLLLVQFTKTRIDCFPLFCRPRDKNKMLGFLKMFLSGTVLYCLSSMVLNLFTVPASEGGRQGNSPEARAPKGAWRPRLITYIDVFTRLTLRLAMIVQPQGPQILSPTLSLYT